MYFFLPIRRSSEFESLITRMKLFSTMKLFGFIFAPGRHFHSTGITAAVAAAQKTGSYRFNGPLTAVYGHHLEQRTHCGINAIALDPP